MSAALAKTRSAFSQVVWLLVLSISLVLLTAAMIFRSQGLAAGVAQMVPLVDSQIWLVQQVLQQTDRAALGQLPGFAGLDLRLDSAPPAGPVGSAYPFPQAVADELTRRRGANTAMQLHDGAPPRLWVQLSGRSGPVWLGLPLPAHMARVRDGALWILGGAALVVLAAATRFARRLTRPLVALAGQAPALLHGQPLSPELLQRAPREVHALAAALQQAGWAAEQQVRERDLMLAGLSHDLRTPLARLRFAVELGDSGSADESHAAMVADIEELDALLGQFIAYARADRSGVASPAGSTEPLVAIDPQQLASALRHSRRDAQLWRFDFSDVPVFHGHPLSLRRALINLLDNAERHAAAPFACSAQVEGERLRFCVSDHGPGLSAEQAQALRQPFARGDQARTTPGSGLGLAIVERFARSVGGELSMQNGPQGGLQVSLCLPLQRATGA